MDSEDSKTNKNYCIVTFRDIVKISAKNVPPQSIIQFQRYSLYTGCPLTILVFLNCTPCMSIQDFFNGKIIIHFRKSDIPYEIGYTPYEFDETDTLDKMLTSTITVNQTLIKEIYCHLINLTKKETN